MSFRSDRDTGIGSDSIAGIGGIPVDYGCDFYATVVATDTHGGSQGGVSPPLIAGARRIRLDRRSSGHVTFSPAFACVREAPYRFEGHRVSFILIVDTCSLELFVGDGEIAMTALVFPFESQTRCSIALQAGSAGSARIERLQCWSLEGAAAQP